MNIVERFQELAKETPQKPFIIFKEKTITFQEGAEKINKLAAALQKMGIKTGEKVAVYLPNCPEYAFSYFAVFSLGAVCVPLDPRLTDQELLGVLNHAEVSVLISKPLEQASLIELKQRVASLKDIITSLPDEDGQVMKVEVKAEDLAVLYYTSGTTGKPKAVMSSYRSLDNAPATIKNAGVELGTLAICALPLSHIGGFIYLQLVVDFKMSLVLMERFVPIEFLRNIEKYQVSWFHLVPAMFGAILQLKEFEKYNLTSVKGVCVFGAPSHPNLIQRFGAYCPNAKLWHGWGMTETAAPNTITDPEHIKSVGKPAPWFQIKIVDNEDKEVPLGGVGEIICRGWPVMLGYYKEPEMTSEILRGGWLRTGDLGCIDKDGYLYIRGRKKDMIIVGGLNVYSPEVEHVIAEHPQVAEVAVVGVADKLRGEAVKAVIVAKEGQEVSEQEIKDFCRQRLTHFKLPQIVEFRETLPKTSSGKIQKELLKQADLELAEEQA